MTRLVSASVLVVAAWLQVGQAGNVRGGLKSSAFSLSSFTPISAFDSPYEETIATRYPFAGSYASNTTVPTGWTQLQCSNATSTAFITVSSASPSLRPVLLCSPATTPNTVLLDLLSNSFYSLQGVDMSVGAWSFAQPASGAVLPAGSSSAWPIPALAVGPTSVYSLTCSGVGGTCTATLIISAHNLPAIVTAGVYQSVTAADAWTLWLGSRGGTGAWDIPSAALAGRRNSSHLPPASPSAPLAVNQIYTSGGYTAAVAFSPNAGVIALGNSSIIMFLSATSPSSPMLRWEWVTLVVTGSGGPVDDVITSLAFDDAAATENNGPVLYIGNPSSLNIAFLGPNTGGPLSSSTFATPVFTRLGPMDYLPYSNISTIAIDQSQPPAGRPTAPGTPRRVFIGTDAGIILFDPTTTATYGAKQPFSSTSTSTPITVNWQQRWRWFAGGRWLPVTPANPMASRIRLTYGLLAYPPASPPTPGPPYPSPNSNGGVLVLTGQGVSRLDSFTYTLEAKVVAMEAAAETYDLHGTGLTVDCSLPSFGMLTGCAPGPNDNSGLWTSLHVAGMAAKYVATNDASALAVVQQRIGGLYLLNNVTGIQGLFARCTLPPGVPPPAVAAVFAAADENEVKRKAKKSDPPSLSMAWHNSSSLPGWTWEGDTSSDEVAGHVMAYTVAQSWLPSSFAGPAAATLLHLVRYVVANNFTLIDVTGQPTTWGRWDPDVVNEGRYWSDQRGLNSLEMLAMLTSALQAVGVAGSGGGANDTAAFTAALNYLLLPENGPYDANMVNGKIVVPDDDNYSDDELMFFSYFPLLLSTESVPATGPLAQTRDATIASFLRTWSLIGYSRPSLWNIMGLALLGANASGHYVQLEEMRERERERMVRNGAKSTTTSAAFSSPLMSMFKGSSSFDSASISSTGGATFLGSLSPPDPATALADSLWNLRTWPIDLVDWPTQNSIRQDIVTDPEVDRDFQSRTESEYILPANERDLFRWNSDPRTLDDGSGYSSTDTGAFLMPYWLARAWGLFVPAT